VALGDWTAITEALVARLSGDAALMALLPDGVWVHEARQGTQRLVFVALESAADAAQFGAPQARRATLECHYVVKAVVFGAGRQDAEQAAARIDALLEDVPLTITGFACLAIARTDVIDETEDDEVNNDIRWQHVGGRYRVLVSPVNGGSA